MDNQSDGEPLRNGRNAAHFSYGCISFLIPPLPFFMFLFGALVFLFSKNAREKADALWTMLGSATTIGVIGFLMQHRVGDFGQ